MEKQAAARRAVECVESGMVLGLGSGSTAAYAIRMIGERVRRGLRVRGIPTSLRSAELARAEGIPLISFDEETRIDLTIDGADEVTESLQLIKGGGGALLREKIVASASARVLIIVDSAKLVPVLGRFPLPVEVLPFARPLVARWLQEAGGEVRLRTAADGQPLVTDQGNHILDCRFGLLADPGPLAARLRQIPGLIEHGLFLDLASCALIGRGGRVETIGAG